MSMPGFNAEKSHYTSSVHYQNISDQVGRSNRAVDLAQLFLRPPPNGNGPCPPRNLGCGPDPDNPGACCVRYRTPECEVTCLNPCVCPPPPPPPVTCDGKCLLPTSQLLQAIQSGNSIDLSTIRFQETCHQGSVTFTRDCIVSSPETRIHIPVRFVSDKCIHVTMGGLDASLINIVTRDC